MEIELDLTELETAVWLAVGAVIVLAALAVVGKAVSPRDGHGNPLLLTPARWQEVKLEREIVGETRSLRKDADSLGSLLKDPDPVDATLLAERIYSHHRRGVSATAGARKALIEAAEEAVLFASGNADRKDAVQAYQEAVNLISKLEKRSGVRRNVQRHSETGTRASPNGREAHSGALQGFGVRCNPRSA